MSINAMSVSAGQALEVLKQGWKMQNNHGIHMSYMLHGRPGIGKTQLAEKLADFIGGQLHDLRLTTIEPSDLRGMPHYDHDARMTVWYRPEDLPNSDEPAVLFFDEITAASPFLLPTVYGILQERRVGQHKIPDNTIIIAAGNTVDDGAVAYEMGTAISDRLTHMLVEADSKDWIKGYAIPNNLHPAVTAFIETRPDFFETTQDAVKQGHMIAATPRSWERVSNIMHHVDDRRTRDIMIAGTVGKHIAAEFTIIADDIAETVRVAEMLEATREERIDKFPASMHGLNAMVFAIISIFNEDNFGACIEIMVDMGNLDKKRPENEEFRKMPLMELTTHGFETLLEKVEQMGLSEQVFDHPVFQEYWTQRSEAGLN